MNPIRYTSRTFDSILADINADRELAGTPSWWKRMIAGVGDVLSMWVNAQANDSVLGTAFTRRSVIELCRQIGYDVAPQSTSGGIVLFHLKPATTFPFSISAADLAAITRGTIAATAMRFEARAGASVATQETDSVNLLANPIAGDVITTTRAFLTGEKIRFSGTVPTGLSAGVDYYAISVTGGIKVASTQDNALAGTALSISGATGTTTIAVWSIRATCYQQETKTANLGTGDGSTAWLEFDVPDSPLLRDVMTVSDGVDAFTRVDTLAESGATDPHYEVKYRSDGSAYVRFGNGTYGKVPNGDVTATYAVGGGAASNVSAGAVSSYAGSSADVDGVVNPAAMTGGSDHEAIETAVRLAPGLLKARDRFITEEDGEFLAEANAAVSRVNVIRNVYGVMSAKVVCVALGGGNLSAGDRSVLQAYLISKTVLSAVDVRVEAAIITSHAVTSAMRAASGYSFADVLPYFRLAWKLFLSEAGFELTEIYASDGLAVAVARVNSIFSEAFAADDQQVGDLLSSLAAFGPRNFGDEIQESDVHAFIQGSVPGIDYMTFSAPSTPISCADDEITTYGALTLTEIP